MAIFNPRFSSWEEAFADAVSSVGGVQPSRIIADGIIHRFSFNGRVGNDSGWYVVYPDEVTGGCVGNWGTGDKINWYYAPKGYDWTPTKENALAKKYEERHKQAEAARINIQINAALDAQKRWAELTEPKLDHPYLVSKGVKPYGIRMGKGRLYVPMFDENGEISSLQSIDDKGVKLFMKGGRVRGCYFLIGDPQTRLFISEGYATAASIHEATGEPIAVCFDAGNMQAAVKSLRKRFPSISITILADNDASKGKNIGLQFAMETADKFNIPYMFPEFNSIEIENGASDYNDYAKLRGISALSSLFKQKQSNKFKVLSFDDLLYAPKVEWIIKGIFPQKSFGTIYGAPGKGKTFVSLDMALCVAHGLQWHGLDVVQGSVLYIAGEGMGGLPKRLKAWTSQYAKNDPTPPFYAIAAGVNMRDPIDVNYIKSAIDDLGQKFSLIVIDTVARAILGGDENDSMDMGLFVASCDAIKEHSGATVIGVHHSGKDEEKGMRGSTALLGAVDTVIQVSQEVEGIIVLKNEKQKDGEPFKDMVFKTAIIATGIDETSIIIEPSDNQTVYQKKVIAKVDLYLEALWDSISGDSKTLNGLSATSIEKWRDLCFRKNLGGDNPDAMRKGFYRARIRLQDAKVICVDGNLVSYTKGFDNV